jgi:hypothetical protein
MSEICADHGMGLDGCTPEWEPGETSKIWPAALSHVLEPDYPHNLAAARNTETSVGAHAYQRIRRPTLLELIDETTRNQRGGSAKATPIYKHGQGGRSHG